MSFDESKVRRERGKFANKDSMRDEAGQVDAFDQSPATTVVYAETLREGNRILHDGEMREIISIDGDHKDMTIELDDDEFITVENSQLVEVAHTQSSRSDGKIEADSVQPGDRIAVSGVPQTVVGVVKSDDRVSVEFENSHITHYRRDELVRPALGGNDIYDSSEAMGNDSLGAAYAATHTWQMDDGTYRTAEATYYVCGQVNDPEDYGYEDAEYEGHTMPSVGNISYEDYDQWTATRSALEHDVASAERDHGPYSDKANDARRRLDEMPSVGFTVHSQVSYTEHTDPTDISGTETDTHIEYDDHTVIAHGSVRGAEAQARELARNTNWNHFEPERFFQR